MRIMRARAPRQNGSGSPRRQVVVDEERVPVDGVVLGNRQTADRSPTMVLALVVWLCTLPFVFLLVMPLLGVRAAVGVALALLLGIALVCWALCRVGRGPGRIAP